MIAPTIEAVAEILSAVKRYGTEVGTRSFQRIAQRPAAYERISSTPRGSTESRPRSVLIATGKKVRYAARIATDTQPATPFDPSPTTTIGAIARIGTVCEATMYGSTPRSSRRDCESATASAKPIAAPSTKPTIASFVVNQRRVPEEWISHGPLTCVGCEERRDDVVQVRHRRVVDGERPRPVGSAADPLVALPDAPERAEHDDEHAEATRRAQRRPRREQRSWPLRPGHGYAMRTPRSQL